MKTTSPFGSINWKDLLYSGLSALVLSIATALYSVFQNMSETGHLDLSFDDLKTIGAAGIGAFVLVFLKQLLQNSTGKHFKKE